MRRVTHFAAVLALVAAACAGSNVDISAIGELPVATPDDIQTLLASGDRPVVLNVWASWCIPCRSEAPLLDRAANRFDAEIRFVGVNVRDSQRDARAFIAEFLADAPIEHFFDRDGDVPIALGGNRGVPLTFFYGRDGTLVELHRGVIDERTLALQIDELLGRS